MQNTRGRFASAGEEYDPLIWEMSDGYDAVEWAAGLPYSDGHIGTTGPGFHD
jgi:predicted acyl esterase